MLKKIEFYTCPDGSVNIQPFDEPVRVYDMSCRDITEEMLVYIKDLYPDAFKALSELYSKNERNKDFFEYRMVHRFVRCNFGEYDGLHFDISNPGVFNFECVRCPLKGECRYEGVICRPKLNTKLSNREEQAAKLLGSGMSKQEVAQEMGISLFTVTRHIANIKARLNLKHTNQIISLFKSSE